MEIVGWIASILTIAGTLYAVCKWLVGKFGASTKKSPNALPERVTTAVNLVNVGFERTFIVPFVVEKTVEIIKTVEKVIIPVFVPNAPPRQPGVPEWLTKPARPVKHPESPETPMPAKTRPWAIPQREPRVPEHTRRPMEGDFTRRPEPDGRITTRIPDMGLGDRPGTPFDVGGHGGLGRGENGGPDGGCGGFGGFGGTESNRFGGTSED